MLEEVKTVIGSVARVCSRGLARAPSGRLRPGYSGAGGRVKRQVVTTGTTDGERIEIVEGLVDGQKVAVSGLSALRDGAEVTVQ